MEEAAAAAAVPPPGVAIRRARPEDLDALLALLSQLYEDDPPLRAGPQSAAVLERVLADASRALLVAEAEGRLLGTLDLVVVRDLTHGAWVAIENVVVDAGARRRGIGAALFEEAERIAREAGATKMQLVSHARREDAHAFYGRAGFDVPVRGFRRRL